MDKVKVALKYLQKYHFWLLYVVVMIAALIGWSMARKSLSAAYDANKGKIEGKFKAVTGLNSDDYTPNADWTKKVKGLTDEEREKVNSAWEKVYDDQQEVLEWPQQLDADLLKFVDENETGTIPPNLCFEYQRLIPHEYANLLALIDAEPSDGGKKLLKDLHKDAGDEKPEERREYKVNWEPTSQTDLLKMITWQGSPSSDQVRMAQENLWVYRVVLQMIKAVNEGARYSVPVRQITSLKIGQEAAVGYKDGMGPGHIDFDASAAAPAGGAAPAEAPVAAGGGEEQAGPKPLDEGRYLGPDGNPLAAGQAANEQFKRVPVLLRLVVDQRDINKLLTECANSPLAIEVRQLRINPNKQGASSTAGPSGAAGTTPKAATSETEQYEVPVELIGIVNLFNPPDIAKLGGNAAVAAPGEGQAGDPPKARRGRRGRRGKQ